MSISIKALEYFNAISESGSISKAMQTLNVSQAGLTEAIQKLEAHLGVLLFRRHARGMSLTHAGHDFLRHTHLILGAIASAEEALSMRPDVLTGELAIGTVTPITAYYLPGLLQRYRWSFPKVAVSVIEEPAEMIEHLVINGEIDIALTLTSHLHNAQGFHSRSLVKSPWKVWMAAGHRLAGHQNITLQEIRNEAIIVLRNEELERTARDLWRHAGMRQRTVVKTRSVEAARSLVATGNGICILPEVLFRPWSLEGNRLVAQSLAEQPTPLELGIIWRNGAPVSPQTQAFIENADEYRQSSMNSYRLASQNQISV